MSTNKKIETELDLVEKVTKQILTLSSGTIVILVTILGYFFENNTQTAKLWLWPVLISSVFFLLAIICGVFIYGILINKIHSAKELDEVDVYNSTITNCAQWQWICFIAGIICLISSFGLILIFSTI